MKQYIAPAGHVILWKEILKLFLFKKSKLDEYLFGNRIILVNSGTSALLNLLSSLKINSTKSEVIIPAYTCPTVPAAIIKAGLKPVLCDINLADFSLLIDDLNSKINTNTLAIIQVELFGILPDNSKIRKIADQNEILLVGDAAQSFGNYVINNKLFESQKYDFLVFSTGRGKPINLLHGGGIIALRDNWEKIDLNSEKLIDLSITEKIRNLIDIIFFKVFFNPKLYVIPKSLSFLNLGETIFSLEITVKKFNTRLLTLLKLIHDRFKEINNDRLRKIELYNQVISKYSKKLLQINYDNRSELIRFPLLFRKSEDRELLMLELQKNGIGASGLYPFPLNIQPGMEKYGLESCSNATLVAERILTLPIHEYVTEKDYKKIDHILEKYLA